MWVADDALITLIARVLICFLNHAQISLSCLLVWQQIIMVLRQDFLQGVLVMHRENGALPKITVEEITTQQK
jgi:hypothetical protein